MASIVAKDKKETYMDVSMFCSIADYSSQIYFMCITLQESDIYPLIYDSIGSYFNNKKFLVKNG